MSNYLWKFLHPPCENDFSDPQTTCPDKAFLSKNLFLLAEVRALPEYSRSYPSMSTIQGTVHSWYYDSNCTLRIVVLLCSTRSTLRTSTLRSSRTELVQEIIILYEYSIVLYEYVEERPANLGIRGRGRGPGISEA
jgi:hypothetical protein